MSPEQAVADVVRNDGGRIQASLIGVVRDFEAAEDLLQDALALALERWPVEGVPQNPGGWVHRVARNRAIDRLRRASSWDRKAPAVAVLKEWSAQERREAEDPDSEFGDERLRLVFTCCHPALAEAAQIALTLRTLGGLSTAEIARAFLVPEATMAQRLVRAQKKIRVAGIPYEVPGPERLAERLMAVHRVLYLIFTEGYAASSGEELVRRELSGEAIRLCRMLDRLLPEDPETEGLLALMLLHDARREGRTDSLGQLVPLERQDRRKWRRPQIDEGQDLVERALRRARVGPYQLQAAIAALHTAAWTPQDTDWQQIAALYGFLEQIQPGPIVRLNRAAAVAMAEGPDAGLALLEGLEIPRYALLPAARADLHRRAGRREQARVHYQEALALAENAAERSYYARRLRELDS